MTTQVVVDENEFTPEPIVASGTIVGAMIGMGSSGGGNTEIIEIDDIDWEYGALIDDEAKIQQVIALRERIKNGEHPNILLKTNWGTNDLYIKAQNYSYMNEEGYEGLWIVFNYIYFNQSEMKILQLQQGTQGGISYLQYDTIVSGIVSG